MMNKSDERDPFRLHSGGRGAYRRFAENREKKERRTNL